MKKDLESVDIYERSNLPKNQLWFWIGQNLQPDAPIFNMPMAITIKGAVDHERFNNAFQQVLKRADALRTVIIPENGVPFRRVKEDFPYDVELLDLSGESDPQASFQEWADKRCRVVFDMQKRMFDAVLVKMAEEEYLWYWCQHHLICDGWSTALVYRYVAEFYEASFEKDLNEMPDFPLFEDYAQKEREYRHSDAHEKSKEFWEAQLSEQLENFSLYGKTGREHGTTKVLRVTRDLGVARTDGLKALAKEKVFRNFSTHLSIFQLVSTCLYSYLYRISGNDTLALGTLYHNRQSQKEKQTVGFFMEMAPIRITVNGNDSFEEVFKKIKKSSNEVLRHYKYAPGNPIHSRSYDVALNYNNASYPDFAGMPISLFWLHTGTWYPHEPLAIQIHDFDETGTFTVAFDFNCGVFDELQRERVIAHFFNCVDALIEDPQQTIGHFNLLTEEEDDLIFNQWADGKSIELNSDSIHGLIEEQAQKTPGNIAVYNSESKLTYKELDEQANQLAHHLISLGVSPNEPVGISMHKTPEVITAILAVLKAGAGYVPLDPEYPEDRLSHMISDSGLKVIVSHSQVSEQLPEGDYQLIEYDKEVDSFAQNETTKPQVENDANNLAYVIYTSGSTGRSKGVMIEHHSIVNYTLSCHENFNLTEQDKVLQFASISFDTAAEEIFPALAKGATLRLVEDDMKSSMKAFIAALEENQITLLDLPTAFWHQLVVYLKEQGVTLPQRIHTLIIGGERAQPQIVGDWVESDNTHVRLLNTYGPTETTIVSAFCELTKDNTDRENEVAIGQPVHNTSLYVLDKNKQPVPLGVVGELYIGGEGVARGYHGRDELTAAAFTSAPFKENQRMYKSGDLVRYRRDGLLEYRDRVDDQVKIRGFRIELGEVEAALMAVEGVNQATVIAQKGLGGDKRLVAYYVLAEYDGITVTQIRNAMRKSIPDYMVPQHFAEIEELPMTKNGKVDKKALPDVLGDSTEEEVVEKPETDSEIKIAEIWKKFIGEGAVGRFDNFFDAGGDSLSMMQVVAAMEQELGFEVSPRMLVSQNLSQIAKEFEESSPAQEVKAQVEEGGGFSGLLGKITGGLFGKKDKVN